MRFIALAIVLASAAFGQDQQQPIPDDLTQLAGKKVLVGRLPLCEPKTFTANLNYAGKQATVVSVKPGKSYKFPPNALSRLTPEMRAQLEDTQKAAMLLLEFEDGTKLDTCAAIGPKRLAENLDLAPGQTITPVSPTAQSPLRRLME